MKLAGIVERTVPLYFRQWFTRCVVIDSTFDCANLTRSDPHGIALRGSRFVSAVLNNANLNGANIEDVDLSTCTVTNVDLHNAMYSIQTALPNGFRLPENATLVSNPDPKFNFGENRTGCVLMLLAGVATFVLILALVADLESSFR